MPRRPLRPASSLLLTCLAAAAAAGCRSTVDAVMNTEPRGELGGLVWLTGSWVMSDANGLSEEHWTRPAGDTMMGLNRTVVRGRTVMFEFLRIEATPQGVIYWASPGGRHPPTPFAEIERSARRVVFENTDHDFPQRIVYRRQGNRLDVRIEGVEDGEPKFSEWTWRRTSFDSMPP